jgi:large subunit ribosomal protein L30
VRQKTGTIHIKWVRSAIALPRQQKRMVASLGLRRLNQVVERTDTAQIRGVVAKIPHLLQVVPAPVPPSWTAVAEYEIVAGIAQSRPAKVVAKRVDEAPGEVAVKLPKPKAAAAEVEASAFSKKAGARKARVSASPKKPAAKREKPRKGQATEDKKSKSPKKGKK